MTREIALEHKAKGNAFFTAKDFNPAIDEFTKAIENDPTDHVFYSNRSACYASLGNFPMALIDGKKCTELKADWPKGYTRVGGALMGLGKHFEAEQAYKQGLEISGNDAACLQGAEAAIKAQQAAQSNGYPGAGKGGDRGQELKIDFGKITSVLSSTPAFMEYTRDDKFTKCLNDLMTAGQAGDQAGMMAAIQSDPRMMEVIMASMDDNFKPPPPKEQPKPKPKKVEPVDERDDKSKAADEFKKAGNELYKAKKFDEAVAQYDKAIEAQPNDVTYYNNKAAVLVEQEKYEEAEKLLTDCLEKRYEMNGACKDGASFEKVAKVFVRLGNIHKKQNNFDQAIEYLQKATLENNSGPTRTALREVQKAKQEHEKKAYEDPDKAEEHRQKGNDFFKEKNFVNAKKEYDEGIKRNPRDPKLYSNRAAALQKLMAMPDALKDLEKAIAIDKTYIKAYIRKGQVHIAMKDFNKAIEVYNRGLEVEPDNQELKQGLNHVQSQIMNSSSGQVDERQVQESMKDPEIQAILKDPQINLVLQSAQENPASLQEYLKDPKIANAINKLIGAGILRTG